MNTKYLSVYTCILDTYWQCGAKIAVANSTNDSIFQSSDYRSTGAIIDSVKFQLVPL